MLVGAMLAVMYPNVVVVVVVVIVVIRAVLVLVLSVGAAVMVFCHATAQVNLKVR